MFKLTWNNPESGTIEYSKRTSFKAEFTKAENTFIVNDFIEVNSKRYANFLIKDFVRENQNFLFHQIEPGVIFVLRNFENYEVGQEYDFQRGMNNIYGFGNDNDAISCHNYIFLDRDIKGLCISIIEKNCYDFATPQPYAKFEIL